MNTTAEQQAAQAAGFDASAADVALYLGLAAAAAPPPAVAAKPRDVGLI